MATKPAVRLRYNPVRTYPGSQQLSYVGAQSLAGRRGVLPTFTDLNTKYVASTGANSNAGTSSAPYADPDYARSQLAGAFKYVVIKDSAVYATKKIVWDKANTGLFAADGQTPQIQFDRGCGVTGSYGSRTSHPAYANPPNNLFFHGQTAYVSKAGNDGTAILGDSTKPYLTIQAAVTAAQSTFGVNYVRIMDSGVYTEDINCGAFGVNIQAAIGSTPTLVNVATGASSYHITNSGGYGMTLSGLNLVENVNSLGSAIYNPAGYVSLVDCTISNGTTALKCGYAGVSNCYFYNAINAIDVSATGGATSVTNCLFSQTRGQAGYGIYSRSTSTESLTVSWCTFTGWGQSTVAGCRCIQRDYPNGAFTAADSVANCVFDGFYQGIQFGDQSEAPTGTGFPTVSNCSFAGGCYPLTFWACPGAAVVSEILCSGSTGEDVRVFNGQANAIFNIGVTSLCSVGNLAYDVQAAFSGTGTPPSGAVLMALKAASVGIGTARTNLTCTNCTIVNAKGYAFVARNAEFSNTSTASQYLTLVSCIENKCLGIFRGDNTISLAPITVAVNYCVYDADAAWVVARTITYTSSIKADAKLLSTIPSAENVGLQPDSVAMGSGSVFVGDDRGISACAFEMAASNVEVNGIQFRAAGTANANPAGLNMRGAVRVDQGLTNVKFKYCTFRRFGLWGMKSVTPVTVLNCEFRDASTTGDIQVGNGAVLSIGAGGSSVQANTFMSLAGAGIANLSPGNQLRNNSSYACLYGQYDGPTVGGTFTGNVYFQSGAYDYYGSGTQTGSCIGTLSTYATLTSGSQLDPLYRDPESGDLRIQTVEFGYTYDSPVKLLVSAGLYAGSFLFNYKPLSTSWTTFTLSYNPDQVEYDLVPVKLAEDHLVNGALYTVAEAYKLRYGFKWGPTNPMETVDLASLKALFQSTTGEVQVTFDAAATWIPVRVERGNEFKYTDLDEAYNVDKPMPVRSLSLIESA